MSDRTSKTMSGSKSTSESSTRGATKRKANSNPQGHQRPSLPLVNLLSPSAFARMATRRLRLRFVAGGAALVVLVLGAWAVQHLRVGEAEKLLAVEQAETARLSADAHTLMPLRAFVTGVELQKDTVSKTMAREIYFSSVLDGMQDAAPSGVRLDSLVVTLAEEPAAPQPTGAEDTQDAEDPPPATGGAAATPTVSPCPGPDPFSTRAVVGCITITGTATSRAEVGDLVIRLGSDKHFVEPFISTTATAEGRVSFSGSVGLSQNVFSRRYLELDRLLAQGGSR